MGTWLIFALSHGKRGTLSTLKHFKNTNGNQEESYFSLTAFSIFSGGAGLQQTVLRRRWRTGMFLKM
jgi:hypothetical protein